MNIVEKRSIEKTKKTATFEDEKKNYNNNDDGRCVMHKHTHEIGKNQTYIYIQALIHLLNCDTIDKRKEISV